MSADRERSYSYDPMGTLTTKTYDASGTLVRREVNENTFRGFAYTGPAVPRVASPPLPPPAVLPAQPLHAQTFEFRLSGSEAQEQSVALGAVGRGGAIVATRCVRAYLTRSGDAGAASSVIGGFEVHAELRDGQLVCSAALSDFGPGDLVVVQVEVAVYP